MKIKKLLPIILILVSMSTPSIPIISSNGRIETNLTSTGYDVIFELTSVRVVDDYDTFASGEWHIFIYDSVGNELAYFPELTISDGGTRTLSWRYTLTGVTSSNIRFQLRAAENDGPTSELTIIDYDRTIFTPNLDISIPITNQFVSDTIYDGSNVYYTYGYNIINLPPVLGGLTQIDTVYGDYINFPSLSVTQDEARDFKCELDVLYDGNFQADFSFTTSNSYCQFADLPVTNNNYPKLEGTFQYAITVKDEKQVPSLATGTLKLQNNAPVIIDKPNLNMIYSPGQRINLHWSFEDLNLMNVTLFANGTIKETKYFSLSNTPKTYYYDNSVNFIDEGLYNLTFLVEDTLGAKAFTTDIFEVRKQNFTGLNWVVPNGGEDFTDEILIKWEPAVDSWDRIVTYELEYTDNSGTTWNTIIDATTETSYLWDTTSLQKSNFYKIRVTAKNGITTRTIMSSDVFHLRESHTISEPQITNPDPNEVIVDSSTITWTKSSDNWDHSIYYNISYSKATVNSWVDIVNEVELNSYDWDVTEIEDGRYKLRIITYDHYGQQSTIISGEFEIINSSDPDSSSIQSNPATTTEPTEPGQQDENGIENPLPFLDFFILSSVLVIVVVIKKRITKY